MIKQLVLKQYDEKGLITLTTVFNMTSSFTSTLLCDLMTGHPALPLAIVLFFMKGFEHTQN